MKNLFESKGEIASFIFCVVVVDIIVFFAYRSL